VIKHRHAAQGADGKESEKGKTPVCFLFLRKKTNFSESRAQNTVWGGKSLAKKGREAGRPAERRGTEHKMKFLKGGNQLTPITPNSQQLRWGKQTGAFGEKPRKNV